MRIRDHSENLKSNSFETTIEADRIESKCSRSQILLRLVVTPRYRYMEWFLEEFRLLLFSFPATLSVRYVTSSSQLHL